MKTFVIAIVATVLVIGPIICYNLIEHPDNREYTTLVIVCLLSWFFGFVTAVIGLFFPKERLKRFYIWGKIICGSVLVVHVYCTLVFVSVCAKALSEIH
jgi:hypothetical protein